MAYEVLIEVQYREKGQEKWHDPHTETRRYSSLKNALADVKHDYPPERFVGRVTEDCNGEEATIGWVFEKPADYGSTQRTTVTFRKINSVHIPIHPLEVM